MVVAAIAVLSACAPQDETNPKTPLTLEAAVAGEWRDPANVARDNWRHPLQTLAFFGVNPRQTVIEITPGYGWYAEILAPLLRENGHYIAAVINPDTAVKHSAKNYYAKQLNALERKLRASPGIYGSPQIRLFDEAKPMFGEPASADVVLTFRNVHNWREADTVALMFKGIFDVLKPGGTLGLVEHRANGDVADDDYSGYIGQNQLIAWAGTAGFVLQATSEINANPADSKDREGGVWRLPPAFSLGDKDRDKYAAIGESDRMTLRFLKP
ncbi:MULTISPECIES: class I SAM-dependent methyltransferase [Methylomonas]|uniref:Methyltransferase n=2 Tax=Methylomonas TaxID=416 RepID=A0A140E4B6_9GAMM|nr:MULTISPECIES: class I SAM-dependent methyltransferase [Methylomonas]AMK75240.1 methyltransferase [Methylomonas denitrificans]OAH99365.1 methyltransferase [Methylomonas methanica]TCV85012.1 putative methyltransferase [Methylomonas methanica]